MSFGPQSRPGGGFLEQVEKLALFSHPANIGDVSRWPSTRLDHDTASSPRGLLAAGVPADMVRLSVGIEHIDDLIADLDQALAAVGGGGE